MLAGRQLQIASHLTVLHVEQEVAGDDTIALESVLECDTKRHSLLQEEKQITAQLQTATGYYRSSYFTNLASSHSYEHSTSFGIRSKFYFQNVTLFAL